MMMNRLVLLFAVVISSLTSASEVKRLTPSEVPKLVADTVNAKYPRAKVIGVTKEITEGRLVYEFQLNKDKTETSVDVDENGKVVSEESVIQPDALPAPAKAAFQKEFPHWKIQKVEHVTIANSEAANQYEVTAKQGSVRKEVVMASDGKILKQEPAPKD